MSDAENGRLERLLERAHAALDDAFPHREVASLDGTGPSWNQQNSTVQVTFADGDTAYLKLANDGDGSRVRTECAAVAYVGEQADVVTPPVLAADPGATDPDAPDPGTTRTEPDAPDPDAPDPDNIRTDPGTTHTDATDPYLVTAPLGDASLRVAWQDADEAEREALSRRVGRALAALHAIEFDHPGHVVGGDADDLTIDEGAWTDVLVERIDRMETVAPADRFAHHFDEVTDAVRANRDRLDDAPAVLVHGDPAMPNVFPTPDGLGFVDWELAHAGDPVRELHRARDQLFGTSDDAAADRYAAALHEGYRERAGSLPDGMDDRTPVYDAVRYLGKSGFYEKWVEFSDQGSEELADEMAAEMERRLDRIR